MLMLYLGLLTPLLALPALMFLARLERWTAPEAATGAATGSVWAAVPGLPHRGAGRARRCSTVVGSVPARDVTRVRPPDRRPL